MQGFASTHDAASQGLVAAILVGVFALLAADRVHRVLIPIGAVALTWAISYLTPFRLISFEASKQAVDLNVILLLFAMMALVGVLKTTNVFPWAVDRLLERSRGNPSRSGRTDHLVHRHPVGLARQRHHGDLRLSDGVGNGAAAQDQRHRLLPADGNGRQHRRHGDPDRRSAERADRDRSARAPQLHGLYLQPHDPL